MILKFKVILKLGKVGETLILMDDLVKDDGKTTGETLWGNFKKSKLALYRVFLKLQM